MRAAPPPARQRAVLGALMLLCLLALLPRAQAQPPLPACAGHFALPDHRLKDHTLFEADGWWYLVSNHRLLPPDADPYGEYDFLYARSQDLCSWELLGVALPRGAPGDADEQYVWAPHVIQVDGTFYLYYTGVNRHMAQSIMLATTMTPAEPASWVKRGVVFRPNHPGMVYPGPTAWSDGRDPMVREHGGAYYLYYMGQDEDGGIIGVARALAPQGPFQDLGPILTEPVGAPESPYVISHEGNFYLYYNLSDLSPTVRGPRWRWAPSPFGPWQAPVSERVGWAHDFLTLDGEWHSSFVVGNGQSIGILPVQWAQGPSFPLPQLGARLYMPLVGDLTDSPDGR